MPRHPDGTPNSHIVITTFGPTHMRGELLQSAVRADAMLGAQLLPKLAADCTQQPNTRTRTHMHTHTGQQRHLGV